MDKNKIIMLNKSKRYMAFSETLKKEKAQTVWKKSVEGFHVLNNYYNIPVLDVLDAGCRLGVLSYFLSELDYSVTGVDIVPEFINEARKNEINAIEGNLSSLPFDDDSFDSVFCREVIEHVVDPVIVLNEFIRVTRSGGSIFISGPIEPAGPTNTAHLFTFRNLATVKRVFTDKRIIHKYCGLLEDEPNTDMPDQNMKRRCFLVFAEVIK